MDSAARIAVAGVNHTTAPLALRERFAVAAEALPAALATLRARHGAAVLLSTCNRTELYVSGGGDDLDLAALGRSFAALAGATPPPEAIYAQQGHDAARHLLRVAAGLDSMVLGEDQILGQVRAAYIAATEAQSTNRHLSRLFHLAIATGRRVRTETALGRHVRSVSAAAVAALGQQLGDLGDVTALVVGAGEAGQLTAQSLAARGVGRLLVASRTAARAAALARAVGGTPLTFADLVPALREADAVVSASAAPGYPLTAALIRAARGVRPTKPLLLLDIAVPRDIDPAAAAEPGVTLLDLDGLRGVAEHAADEFDALARAEAIVEEEVARLAAWWRTLHVVPTIGALRDHAETIRRAELARTFARMPHLSPDERARIESLTNAIVSKLLHQPISRLKQPDDGARYAALVNDLFNLPPVATPDEGDCGP